MQRSLGEKIGEGGTSDVHVWAPGQVVKLFKAGSAQGLGWHEAQMARAVFDAGGPAPEVLGVVWVEGRIGIVLPRLDGSSLLQLWEAGAVTSEQAGAILAPLYMSVHATPPPKEVPRLRDWFRTLSRGGLVPDHIAKGVLTRIERLPAGDVLCHGDLYPANVIMTAAGPRIIDWSSTVIRAPAAFDLWRGHIKLKELAYAPESLDQGPAGALNMALRSEYAQRAGLSPAALAIEPYLPILRAVALAEGALFPSLAFPREQLIQRLEADLGSED
jgi:Ser/Thr protein kinase RdoA (MazF antagonist)